MPDAGRGDGGGGAGGGTVSRRRVADDYTQSRMHLIRTRVLLVSKVGPLTVPELD